MKTAVCVPTLNASKVACDFLHAIPPHSGMTFLAIDSSSTDGTSDIFAAKSFRIHVVQRESFDHGSVRQLAVELNPDADIIVFMTQDAILADTHALQNLVRAFDDPSITAAYGRQLPAQDATPIAAHARLFNYPPKSRVKTTEDIPTLGIKTAFISNSFAAYRRSALEAVGGFPKRCIVSEDTYVAAKMLLAGWNIAYCADAAVYHSHNYNWRQDFQRYFDIGVFHAREPWVRKKFGGAEGEGRRFLKSEVKYLSAHAPSLLFSSLMRSLIKYLGFRIGLLERMLPVRLKSRLSMQKAYWLHSGRGPAQPL